MVPIIPYQVTRFKRRKNVLLAAGYTQSVCMTDAMSVNDVSFSNELLQMNPRQYCLETNQNLSSRNGLRRSRNLADVETGSMQIVYSCAHCKIDSICMVCARQCHSAHAIKARLNVRSSVKKDGVDRSLITCQCYRNPSLCLARWSIAREQFEKIALPLSHWNKNGYKIKNLKEDQTFIPIFKVRVLLDLLRSDIQDRLGDTVLSRKIMDYAWENAVDVLGEETIDDDEMEKMKSIEQGNCHKCHDTDTKSSQPVSFYEFERWYLEYFDMNESDDD